MELVPVGGGPLVGDVAAFDEARGLGVIEYGPGRTLPFHCTAITDGTRRIPVGAVVAFSVTAGRLGLLEARTVRPLPGVVRPGSSLTDVAPGTPRVVPPDPVPVATGTTVDVDRDRVAEPEPVWSPPQSDEPVPVDPLGAPGVPGVPGVGVPSFEVEGPPSGPAPGSDVTPPSGVPSLTGFEGSASSPSSPVSATPVVPPEPEPSAFDRFPSVVDDAPGPDDASAPRPDFWSPMPRPATGPPPTWRVPVTPPPPPPSDGD